MLYYGDDTRKGTLMTQAPAHAGPAETGPDEPGPDQTNPDQTSNPERRVPTRRISFEESIAELPRHFADDGDLIPSHLAHSA